MTLLQIAYIISTFRNILVGFRPSSAAPPPVKVSDLAAFLPRHSADYSAVREGGRELLLPLRWVPWEVYILGWSARGPTFRRSCAELDGRGQDGL